MISLISLPFESRSNLQFPVAFERQLNCLDGASLKKRITKRSLQTNSSWFTSMIMESYGIMHYPILHLASWSLIVHDHTSSNWYNWFGSTKLITDHLLLCCSHASCLLPLYAPLRFKRLRSWVPSTSQPQATRTCKRLGSQHQEIWAVQG